MDRKQGLYISRTLEIRRFEAFICLQRRVVSSGAGVGVGMLRGRGIPLVENKKVSKFRSFKVLKFNISKLLSFEVSRFQEIQIPKFQNLGTHLSK